MYLDLQNNIIQKNAIKRNKRLKKALKQNKIQSYINRELFKHEPESNHLIGNQKQMTIEVVKRRTQTGQSKTPESIDVKPYINRTSISL